MRCACCNKNLNDFESTNKHAETKEYLDMCLSCLEGLNINYIGRKDLNPYDSVDDSFEDEFGDDDEYA